MQIYTSEDFQRWLDMLPNDPANTPLANELQQAMAECQVIKHPYTFEVDFASGAAATGTAGSGNIFAAPTAAGALSVTGNFIVDSSSPFMLVSTAYQSDVAAAAVTQSTRPSPNQVVMIQDQSSNRNFMNAPVPVPSLFGTGQLPYFWPIARLIPANSQIVITMTNYDAASVPNTRLSFHGYRFYSVSK